MQDWLAARKNATPEKTAFVCGGEQMSFYEFDQYVKETYARIQFLASIDQGQTVGVLLPAGVRHVATVFALMWMKAVYVPLNLRLTTNELKWQLKQANCKYLLCSRDTEKQAYVLAGVKLKLISFDETEFDTIESLAWITDMHIHGELAPPVELDRPFAVIHTSGTSGQPKGAVLTYENVFYSAMSSAYRLGHQPDDRWLCVLPLYHVGGLSILIRAILYGITVDLHPRFDLDAINEALDAQPITLISLVPTMLHRLLDNRERWPESLRLILLGGAAASPELLERCRELNLPVATTYGLTEAASQVATMLPADAYRKSGSVGKPLMFTSVKIIAENGGYAAPNEYGEIVVSGPTVMQGYYNNPEATAKALRNGELYTGDIGYLDDEGDLFVVQRRSDLIVSGGENVYPAEVELVLRQNPAVKEVAVVGIPDAKWGQRVVAAIELESGYELTVDELLAFSRERLAGYKQPRQILFVDELPQTASGKTQRQAVVGLFTKAG